MLLFAVEDGVLGVVLGAGATIGAGIAWAGHQWIKYRKAKDELDRDRKKADDELIRARKDHERSLAISRMKAEQ